MVPWRKTAVTITTCWRPTKSPAFADHVVCFLLSTGFCPTCCWYLESYLPCHSYVTWCHLCRRSSSLGALGWLEKLCFSILGLVIRKRYKFCSSLQKKKKKKGSHVNSSFQQASLSTTSDPLPNGTHPLLENLLSVSPSGVVCLHKDKSPRGNIQFNNITNVQSSVLGNRNRKKNMED